MNHVNIDNFVEVRLNRIYSRRDAISCFSGIETLVERYRAAGLNVRLKLYPGGRHEMFNEINAEEVVGDLVSWMLAEEAGVDPVPVATIENLKRLLSEEAE